MAQLNCSSPWLIQFHDSQARVSAESLQKSSGNCRHDFRLDEEVGVLCRICGFVSTEIKHVSAPFVSLNSRMKSFSNYYFSLCCLL